MTRFHTRPRLLLVLLLSAVLLRPGMVGAQCMTAISNGPGTFMNAGMTYRFIGKSITNGTMCTLTGYNNVRVCAPGMLPQTTTGAMNAGSYVSASADLALMNVFCQWNCNCGQVVISGAADGLPNAPVYGLVGRYCFINLNILTIVII